MWLKVKHLPFCHFLFLTTTHLGQRLNRLIITRKTCFISRNLLHEFRQTGSRGVHVSLVIGEKWQCPQRRTGLMSHFNNASNNNNNNELFYFPYVSLLSNKLQTLHILKYIDLLTVVGLYT